MITRCYSCWLTLAVAAVLMASGCSETKAPPIVPFVPSPPQPGGPGDGVKTPPKATQVVPGDSAPDAENASPVNAPRVNAPKKGTRAPVKPTVPLAEPI